jgi:hypothetical protein
LRFAAWGRLRKEGEGNKVVGLLPQALERKLGEEYLSVTWVEYFPGDKAAQIVAAVRAFRATHSAGGKSAFGIANVGILHEKCLSKGSRVRVTHEPEVKNKGHSAIRQLPDDNLDLLDLLAKEAFTDLIFNADIP